MEQLTCCFDCVPINRPAVGRLFSYRLGGKNNLIVIIPFAVGAADLQNTQICCPAEEKHAGSNAKLSSVLDTRFSE